MKSWKTLYYMYIYNYTLNYYYLPVVMKGQEWYIEVCMLYYFKKNRGCHSATDGK